MNNRTLPDPHDAVLGVFSPQHRDGLAVACAAVQQSRSAGDQHVSQTIPILVITVDDHGYARIRCYVADPLESQRRTRFRFFVDRRINSPTVEDKANGYDMRLSSGIRRGEMSDAGGTYEGGDGSG
jgi:hypothetical protein